MKLTTLSARAEDYAEILGKDRQVTGSQRWCPTLYAAGVLGANDWREMQVPA